MSDCSGGAELCSCVFLNGWISEGFRTFLGLHRLSYMLVGLLVATGVACRPSRIETAVLAGNALTVAPLLKTPSDANAVTSEGWPVLVEAAYRRNSEVVHLLLQSGALVNATNPNGFTALMEAAKKGDVNAVRELLARGADTKVADTNRGFTALALASFGGHLEIVELLINGGSDVNSPDKQGVTPLMWAIRRGHVDVVRHLLSRGADVNHMTDSPLGSAPIIDAVDQEKEGAVIVSLLVAARADLETEAWKGETPLTRAARLGNTEAALVLLSNGARPNMVGGYYRKSPLMWASASNDVRLVRALLRAGAFIEAKADDLLLCATCEALEHGANEALDAMLGFGASPDAIDPESKHTLLGMAVLAGNMEAVRTLLRAGARSNLVAADGKTAEALAAEREQTEIAEILRAARKRSVAEGEK